MDRLRLSLAFQAALSLAALGQAQPLLKKENTFILESITRESEEAIRVRYEVPFDGMVEFRLLTTGDSVVYFNQWPSAQGKRERRLPIPKKLSGTYTYRITYKGVDYTGQAKL